MLSVAIISIDDANITNSKYDEKRANKSRTGAHNVMSNKKQDVYNSYNEVLPRNKDGERKHKGKERNDLEESGCTEKREWNGLSRENYKRVQSQTAFVAREQCEQWPVKGSAEGQRAERIRNLF